MSETDILHLLLTLVYSVVGMTIFGVALLIITKVAPFSIKKEIEEDQNVALGIIIGSVLIGLSLIISAAMPHQSTGFRRF